MRVIDLEAIRIKLASPEEVLNWSHGEITKPETINYRTQRSEKDGLFCEKIFGPTKDYECYCGKYKGIRYKGMVCDRCGVEVCKSQVRRDRMGHIKLASPVSHIWFLRGVPSRMGVILDLPMHHLEKVIYFASYIITSINEEAKKNILEEIEKEFKSKSKSQLAESSKTDNAKKGAKPKKEKKIKLTELKAAKDKARDEVLSLRPFKILSEIEYHDLSLKYGEVFSAGTGAETVRNICEQIDLKKEIEKINKDLEEKPPMEKRKIMARLKIFQGMSHSGIRPEWMFLTMLPVIPPDLRPMVQLDGGRYASSDLNDLYRRVINRNNRLKYLLEIHAPEVIVRNEKRMLQEAVDALIDNSMRKGTMTLATTGGKRLLKSLADILKGKQGRFRQNLLGKRVDYSGRSVIVVGPELRLDQVGLPKKMALELFKPFVIKRILDKELAYNVRGASRLIDEQTDDVWAILEEVVKNKVVLLNRAPTLHRLGIQAFYPILIEGESLKIHPMVCKAFNADFDGDQMDVHLPLSDLAQKEAREKMLSAVNLLKPATGTPICSLNQDIALGCYWMTDIWEGEKGEGKIYGSKEEAILAYEFGELSMKAKIKIRLKKDFIETCLGRVIFNEALPEGFSFQNKTIKSKDLEKLIAKTIEAYPSEIVEETLDNVKNLGFEYSTLSGVTWGMDDLIIPPEKPKIIEEAEKEVKQVEEHFKKGFLSKEEKASKVIGIWSAVKSKIEVLVPKTLPKTNPVFQIIEAGAKGSWGQPVQMTGMKGLVINPVGQIIELPVKNSYKEGFDVLEYFISTHGARKGTADTALRTSTAGYLTRRLVDVAHEIVVHEEDCGDSEGIEVLAQDADDVGQNFLFKIVGRVSVEAIKGICKEGEIIGWNIAEKIIENNIRKLRVRSPLSCNSTRGVCQKCYGWDLGKNKIVEAGEAVGVVAAQAIGEPGTQLTMRTFHTGGVASGGDITSGLPRVQEVFEGRSPLGKGEVSKTDGKVLEITQDRIIKIKPTEEGKKSEVIEYQILPKTALLVKVGQDIKKGQQLSEGSLDIGELFKLTDKETAQRYIINQIQKIYASQGARIHDKHIEVIIRQMFSRVKIKDRGDGLFSNGEIIEKSRFLEENQKLKKDKKDQAKSVPILLGISRVALTSDSFLSAASFQETSRVLIKAAIEGKEDRLLGLKENVIIGKLIPAGTGFVRKDLKK